MLIKKLNQHGYAHWIVPALVVIIIGAVGVKVLIGSHADSISTTSSTTSTTLAATVKKVLVLGASNSTHASSGSTYTFDEIGSPSNVDYLAPGDTLTYNNCTFDYVGCSVKGNVTSCFTVYIPQPKGGTAIAKVEFANNNNSVVRNLSSGSLSTGNLLQQVCVPPGTKINPGFSVKNLTPLTQNTNVVVYQDTISW